MNYTSTYPLSYENQLYSGVPNSETPFSTLGTQPFSNVSDQNKAYYYNITGDLQKGSNKTQSEFNYANATNVINTTQGIVLQNQGWVQYENVSAEVLPMFDVIKGFGAIKKAKNVYKGGYTDYNYGPWSKTN